jgi:hypothetical protein
MDNPERKKKMNHSACPMTFNAIFIQPFLYFTLNNIHTADVNKSMIYAICITYIYIHEKTSAKSANN